MTRFPCILLAAALLPACTVVNTSPDARRRTPVARPEPAPAPRPPAPRPEAPEPVACAPDAAPIYVETTTTMVGQPLERLTIRASGAWSYEIAGAADALEPTDRGCLPADMRARFSRALRAADFRPPPPPEITCMAVPTNRIEYRDVRRDRIAHATRPCGDAASADVIDLSTAARMLTVEPMRATAIPLPQS